jgi:hypothetical protein
MTSKVYVDGLLVTWGEGFFEGMKLSPTRRPSNGGGVRRRKSKPGGGGEGRTIGRVGGRLEARAVRGRLTALVSRAPQVMVKVYGGGKGAKQIREHLRYIGRQGEVQVEDADGLRTTDKSDIDELAAQFKDGPIPMQEVSTRREAINIVLSMPQGTDPMAVKKAARDFAVKEFPNHLYAMALHTIDTPHFAKDKDDPPSPHPHVHLIVKSEGFDGRRLNPRKADLHRWREAFAQAMRDHGVEAVATSRAHRLDRRRGDSRAVREMKAHGKPFTRRTRGPADQQRIDRAQGTERTILRRYAEVAQILAHSDDTTDRALATALAQRFGIEQPTPPPHEQTMATPEPSRGAAPVERHVPRNRTGTDDLER